MCCRIYESTKCRVQVVKTLDCSRCFKLRAYPYISPIYPYMNICVALRPAALAAPALAPAAGARAAVSHPCARPVPGPGPRHPRGRGVLASGLGADKRDSLPQPLLTYR